VIERLLEAERMLSFGQLDHAEAIYRQVADADPKNSIAVVGLARIALERGDDLSSYMLARRALGIDPENDAARRLAVRLEEVLATRGQPVADPMQPSEAAPHPPPDAASAITEGAPPPAPETPAPSTSPPPAAHVPKEAEKRRSIIDRIRGA
jgi:thioredoxin-like negative regulator of GroEL